MNRPSRLAMKLEGERGVSTPIERFWAKVDKRGPEECWEWQASRQHMGHGLLRVSGKLQKAHRFSYELHNGPISTGLIVRHKCDNPPCVNPRHLEVGTYADNAHDRDERGRHRALRGEQHPRAKLTLQAVQAIREAPRQWGQCQKLADQYGVALGTIYNVRSRGWREAA